MRESVSSLTKGQQAIEEMSGTKIKGMTVWVLAPEGVEFQTKLPGDVGHDLHIQVLPSVQSWVDRLISFFLRRPVYILWPMQGKNLPSGVFICMPEWMWAEVKARSSTMKRKMQVLGGTIDSGYTGEMYTILHNFGLVPRIIEHGGRYSQVVFHAACRPITTQVMAGLFANIASEKTRGERGFGSTGA